MALPEGVPVAAAQRAARDGFCRTAGRAADGGLRATRHVRRYLYVPRVILGGSGVDGKERNAGRLQVTTTRETGGAGADDEHGANRNDATSAEAAGIAETTYPVRGASA